MGAMYDVPYQGDHDIFVNSWIFDIQAQGSRKVENLGAGRGLRGIGEFVVEVLFLT